MKKEDNKRKKEECDNLHDNEKEQLRKYEEKGKKAMHDSLGKKKEEITKMKRKEIWINIYKLYMKEAIFLIMFRCVV